MTSATTPSTARSTCGESPPPAQGVTRLDRIDDEASRERAERAPEADRGADFK
jgi:hypothetical protein